MGERQVADGRYFIGVICALSGLFVGVLVANTGYDLLGQLFETVLRVFLGSLLTLFAITLVVLIRPDVVLRFVFGFSPRETSSFGSTAEDLIGEWGEATADKRLVLIRRGLLAATRVFLRVQIRVWFFRSMLAALAVVVSMFGGIVLFRQNEIIQRQVEIAELQIYDAQASRRQMLGQEVSAFLADAERIGLIDVAGQQRRVLSDGLLARLRRLLERTTPYKSVSANDLSTRQPNDFDLKYLSPERGLLLVGLVDLGVALDTGTVGSLNFSYADLRGAKVAPRVALATGDCHSEHWPVSKYDLSGIDFSHSNISGAEFSNVYFLYPYDGLDARGTIFSESYIGALAWQKSVDGLDFRETTIEANSNIDLSGFRMYHSKPDCIFDDRSSTRTGPDGEVYTLKFSLNGRISIDDSNGNYELIFERAKELMAVETMRQDFAVDRPEFGQFLVSDVFGLEGHLYEAKDKIYLSGHMWFDGGPQPTWTEQLGIHVESEEPSKERVEDRRANGKTVTIGFGVVRGWP